MNEVVYTPPPTRPQKELTTADARAIAGQHWAIEWDSETHGFMQCPGAHLHSTANGKRDCSIHVSNDEGKAPTIHCLHASCSTAIEAANKTLRSELGKASFIGERAPIPQKQKPQTKPADKQIDVSPIPIPEPISDGFLRMMELCFLPGEYVAIAQSDGDNPNEGITWKREKWEKGFREKKGDAWEILSGALNKEGLYIRVNPMKRGGKGNDDVTAFRHLLVEFDKDKDGATIPREVQFGILTRSGLPISTITDSAKKSLHAWVRVDAKDATEYRERAEQVYALFEAYGVDKANRNPSRLSRCPDGLRTVDGDIRVQRLLATNIGPKTWAEYQTAQKVAMVGDAVSLSELLDYDTKNDPNSVLGDRWLCKGASCLFVAQSGIGKSSLAMQLAIGWALELPHATFNIRAKKPLKSLLIQAENDRGDMAEQVQGVVSALGLTDTQRHELNDRLIIFRDATHSGHEFLAIVESLVRIHKPDLVWIDPLLNYIGDDISDQAVCSAYTQRISQIGIETGAVFLILHHTGKPRVEGAKTASDLAYMGLGSSVLTAWAREVVTLQRTHDLPDGEACFEITCTKRRKRAGMFNLETNEISANSYIQHMGSTICWALCKKPEPPEEEKPKKKWSGRKSGGGNWYKNNSWKEDSNE